MADFIFKPSANGAGVFTDALEFEGLDPAETVNAADGTYDIYQKVVSSFQVLDISAQFAVADVGEEPVITAADGNVSVTIGSGIHAGTYTTRITDGATLTVAMIEAAATPIILPTISGTETEGETLTATPGVWLYAGVDAGDQTFLWVNNTDGDTAETSLSYTSLTADLGDTIKVSESYGGVTVDSANTGPIVSAGVTPISPATLTTKLFFEPSDSATVFQLNNATTPAGAGDPVGYLADKSGNAFHMTSGNTERPLISGSGLLLDGTDDTMTSVSTTGQFPNLVTIFLRVDTTDTQGILLRDDNTRYLGVIEQSSGSGGVGAGAGTPTMLVNATSVTTRGELYTALTTEVEPIVRWTNADLSNWNRVCLAGYAAAGFSFGGTIYSMFIIENTALSAGDIPGIEQWMRDDANGA